MTELPSSYINSNNNNPGMTSIVSRRSPLGELLLPIFDELSSQYIKPSTWNPILIIGDTNPTSPLRYVLEKLSASLSELEMKDVLERIQYSQCFDIQGIKETLNESILDENIQLPFESIIIMNIKEMFNTTCLLESSTANSRKLLNEVLIMLRRNLNLSTDGIERSRSIYFLDRQDQSSDEGWFLDYYIDKKILC